MKKRNRKSQKLIKAKYPRVEVDKLIIRLSKKKQYKNQIVVEGPHGGETKISLDDGSGLQQDVLKKSFLKKILGDSAETIIRQNSDLIRKKQKELDESRKREFEAKQSLNGQNELVMSINERLNKEKAKIDQLKDLPEYEEEIKRKKQLAKNLEKDLKDAIKERKEREKK